MITNETQENRKKTILDSIVGSLVDSEPEFMRMHIHSKNGFSNVKMKKDLDCSDILHFCVFIKEASQK